MSDDNGSQYKETAHLKRIERMEKARGWMNGELGGDRKRRKEGEIN